MYNTRPKLSSREEAISAILLEVHTHAYDDLKPLSKKELNIMASNILNANMKQPSSLEK